MKFINFNKLSPSRKLIAAFLFVIFFGTVLLKMPFSLQDGIEISYLTSLFTVVSSICVTGLTVVDVSSTFSNFGSVVIMLLIQLGGLGIMTFSSLLFLLAGKKMTFYEREVLKEERNISSSGEIIRFVKGLIITVFLIESIGAIILAYEFAKSMPLKEAVYTGIFHSISAFCNAGFSLFPKGLETFGGNFLVDMTISYLIILGGIGFAVINSFILVIRRKVNRFTLTSKLAITISIILVFGMMFLFLALEYNNPDTIGNLSFFDKVMASFFQSVSLRSAGFNITPITQMRTATIFVSCMLMFIGASPGSTGGGIKTTTFGVLLFYVIGIVRKKENIEVFNRRLDWEIMNRALAIFIISLAYVGTVILLILTFDTFSMDKVMFEVISAFGTVGLTLGITPELNVISQILIITTMFVGRLGPLTFAVALRDVNTNISKKYPKENIQVG